MKKTININLGGYALTIDEDAYQYLDTYLNSIRRRFKNSEGCDEILSDIESRMGELLTTNLGSRAVVQLADVEGVTYIMGKPEEFGIDDDQTTESSSKTGSATGSAAASAAAGSGRSSHHSSTGKRLFRDEEDATVGGVCSGLASYFGVADPLWIRLGFVLLTFFGFGFPVPAYILLWILVPPARSAADRLAMRGEDVNVDNIAREIEEGMERLSRKVNEFGESVKKKNDGKSNPFLGLLSVIVGVIGKIFRVVALAFRAIFKGVGFTVLFAVLFALAGLWIATTWVGFASSDLLSYMSPLSTGMTYLGVTNLAFLFGIPIIGIFLLFGRLLLGFRPHFAVPLVLIVLWVINFFSAATLSAKGFSMYQVDGEISETRTLQVPGNLLEVDLAESGAMGKKRRRWHRGNFGINSDHFSADSEELRMESRFSLRLEPAKAGGFGVEKIVMARGKDKSDAESMARAVRHDFALEGNVLKIPKHFSLPKGAKFRDQDIEMTILVPIGQKIKLNGSAIACLEDAQYSPENDGNEIWMFPAAEFVMTEKGLFCPSCPALMKEQKRQEAKEEQNENKENEEAEAVEPVEPVEPEEVPEERDEENL